MYFIPQCGHVNRASSSSTGLSCDPTSRCTMAEMNIPAIVHLLVGSQLSPVEEELARLTCPHCGIKYMEFRGEGRLGCPHDYAVFRAGLEPILRRVHRATAHVGKSPPHHLDNRPAQAALYD